MLAFMGKMLGQGTRLKARRPALAFVNVHLCIFFLHCFHLLSILGEGNGEGVVGFALCHVVCLAR